MELVCLLALFLSLAYGQELVLEMEPVWLTVSSLKRTSSAGVGLEGQELQLNWGEGVEEVALYTSDPSTNSSLVFPEIQITTEDHPSGMYQTNYSVRELALPGGWALNQTRDLEPGDHCFPFWIGALSNGSLDYVQCLKIRPTWMFDNSQLLGRLSLTSLLWPGTHNSGCYGQGLSLSPGLARFLLTQDHDVYTQLVFGIRYIDLRVGVFPVKSSNISHGMDLDKSFWVNHDMIKVRPLLPILRQIRQFLSQSPQEVVVVDLHRFPMGFSGRHARHNHLVALLERELRPVAVEYQGNHPTLETLWRQKGQLIIAYGDNEVAKKHSWLWPPVRQQWGNQQTVRGLEQYLECCMSDEELRSPERGLWAAMAQLTPGPADLLLRPHQSLRAMAAAVNPHLTTWLRERWAARQANVLTSDFFLGNNAVDISVAANLQRSIRAFQTSTL